MKNSLYLVNIFALFLFSSCGKLPSSEPNGTLIHFNGDFENATFSNFHYLIPDTSINTTIVTNPVRKGNYALKNTLRPDDYINNGYRAELAVYNCAEYKTDVFYGFSFLIDPNYTDSSYNLICQWQDLPNYSQGENWQPHPNLRGSSPPIALVYVNGKLEIKMNDNPQSNNHTFLVGSPTSILKGEWYDVVAHIYWNDNQTAFLELWVDGELKTPFNGIDNKYYQRNLFNRDGNYFKFGQYRGKNNPVHENTMFFDEVKIGSSYNEVSP